MTKNEFCKMPQRPGASEGNTADKEHPPVLVRKNLIVRFKNQNVTNTAVFK